MKITIKDVAKIANVSISTVSRVSSGGDGVSAKTRRRILRVIKERIRIKEALKIFTEGASYALHENKGQVKEGIQADFIVLSENPLHLPIQKIPSLRVLQTY
ncbi:unnamed protein product, partial [marine sediment metagenome]